MDQSHLKEQLWLNELVSIPGKVLLRRKGLYASGWYMVVATNSGSATYVWPMVEIPMATDSDAHTFMPTLAKPGATPKLGFIAIVDLNDWEAYHIESLSPLHAHMKYPKTFMGKLTSICFLARGDPEPLVRVSAKRCCWSLGVVFLRRLAGHLSVAVDPGCSMFDACSALVT